MPFKSKMADWKKEKAKDLRNNPTSAEHMLWQYLRARKFNGLKFRRQAPMLGYIADFYCPSIKLVIEVDGGVHNKNKEYDKHRDEFMEKCGFKVFRVRNYDVYNNLPTIFENLEKFIEKENLLNPAKS